MFCLVTLTNETRHKIYEEYYWQPGYRECMCKVCNAKFEELTEAGEQPDLPYLDEAVEIVGELCQECLTDGFTIVHGWMGIGRRLCKGCSTKNVCPPGKDCEWCDEKRVTPN